MTRQQTKNKINAILRETTKGLFKDTYWEPVSRTWDALREAGFELNMTGSRYNQDDAGNLISKVWTYEIKFGDKKPILGVLTAHGAGSVLDPLDKYDISAYVS